MDRPPIRVYNSLTRQKEVLEPLAPGRVTIYLCGLTVYDHWHLGHALQAMVFDAVARYLEHRGLEVRLVKNFTDIDDKIVRRATEEGTDWRTVADRYIAGYLADLPRLNVRRATLEPRATDHIPEIVALTHTLVERGHAYAAGGDVYFDVATFPGYGELSGQRLDMVQTGTRPTAPKQIRHPEDFALWKHAADEEPGFDSPWGRGRPGWHIECSAMAMKYLGPTIDIHAGGLDLVFPHHENERAQSEAATGRPFARVWMHNGLLRIQGEKMSKSLGNTLQIHNLLRAHSPAALRHFVLSSHYRSPAEFSPGLLEDSARAMRRFGHLQSRLERYRQAVDADANAQETALPLEAATGAASPATPSTSPAVEGSPGEAAAALTTATREASARFEEEMSDDFNTAGALGALFTLAGHANRLLQRAEKGPPDAAIAQAVSGAVDAISWRLDLLGFPPRAVRAAAGEEVSHLADLLVRLLVELRQEARARKEFAQADRIRQALARMGITLTDTPQGTQFSLPQQRVEEEG